MTRQTINELVFFIILLYNAWMLYKAIRILKVPDEKLNKISQRFNKFSWVEYTDEERKKIIRKNAKSMVVSMSIMFFILLILFIVNSL